jgi:hypothetical protein
VAEVELVRGAIGVPGFAEDEDVVAETEGIRVDGARADVDVGVVTASLAGGGAIEVPLWEFVDGLDGTRECLYQLVLSSMLRE